MTFCLRRREFIAALGGAAALPLARGSLTCAKTTGIVRVSRWRATVAGVEAAKMATTISIGHAGVVGHQTAYLDVFTPVVAGRQRNDRPRIRPVSDVR